MGLLRSEEMGYYNIIMGWESAYDIMSDLGGLESIQLVDQNVEKAGY